MRSKSTTKKPTPAAKRVRVGCSEIVSLRNIWKVRAREYRFGKYWMHKDENNVALREAKANELEACICELNYLLKYGRAG